jgi:hypothetical protein
VGYGGIQVISRRGATQQRTALSKRGIGKPSGVGSIARAMLHQKINLRNEKG